MKKQSFIPIFALILFISILSPLNAMAASTKPVIKSFTADLPSKQLVGTTITLTATPATSGNYTYQFSYSNGSLEIPISDSVITDNSASFTPTEAGTYTFYVRAVDDQGTQSTVKRITGYRIVDNVIVKSLKINKTSPQNIGTVLRLTASGKNGVTPYQYQFSYQLNGGTPIVIQDYARTSYTNFTPDVAGNYTFSVLIKDAYGNLSTEAVSDPFTVGDIPIAQDLTVQESSPQNIGTTLNLFTTATGGSGSYTFNYSYKKSGGSIVDIPASDVSGNGAVFTPAEAGNYTFYVKITDSNGLESETIKSKTFKITETLSVKSLIVNKTSPQNIGTTLRISASGTNGITPYQYQFSYQLNGGTPVVLQEFSRYSYVRFNPETAGNYIFTVQIKDASDNYVVEKSSDIFTIDDLPLVNDLIVQQSSPQNIGTTLDLSASATGGSGSYTYDFSYKLGSGEIVPISSSDVTENSAVFTPTETGTYTFYAKVTDSNGLESETIKSKSFKITETVSVRSLIINKTSPQNIGTTLRLTASGTNGITPYQYQFSYQVDGGATTIIKDFSKYNYVNFKPDIAGNYTFSVQIKDANDNLSVVEESDTFTVGDLPIADTLTIQESSPQNIGSTLNLTASASGGSGTYTYDFSYKLGSADIVAIPASDVTENSAVFTPTEAGSYTFYVKATDSNGNESQTIQSKGFKITESVLVRSFTLNKTSPQNIGTSLRLAASGTKGVTPYQYQFSYQVDGGATTIIKDFSKSNYVTFKPEFAGTYTFSVLIKDTSGNMSGVEEINSFTVTDNPIADDLVIEQSSPQNIGTTLNLSATVNGGTSPYTYDFSYKIGSGDIVAIPASDVTGNSAVFTPSEAGTYTFYVKVTDSSGTESNTIQSNSLKIVESVTIRSLTINKTSPQNIGTSLKLTAYGSKGISPYQYQFSYTLDGGDPVIIKDFTKYNYVTFKPETAGSYTFSVKIKDASGNSAIKDSDAFIIEDNSIIGNLIVKQTSPQNINKELTLYASATNGIRPYQYQFSYKIDNGALTIIQDYSTSAYAKFTPTEAGNYTFYVEVKDSRGTTSEPTASDVFVVENNPVLTALETDLKRGEATTDTPVTVTATSIGGVEPLAYSFTYTLKGSTPVEIDSSFISDNIATYEFPEAGSYTITATVTDANGNTDTEKISGYTVINPITITNDLQVTFPATDQAGQMVVLTIPDAYYGFPSYTYQFYYSLDGGDLKNITYLSTLPSVGFILPTTGTYTFYATATDTKGYISNQVQSTDYAVTLAMTTTSIESVTADNVPELSTSTASDKAESNAAVITSDQSDSAETNTTSNELPVLEDPSMSDSVSPSESDEPESLPETEELP
ncbi:MAG: hypothetical protein PWP30_288 [Eubacteriaceae bacterium]|jgi:hypothetical protein|nr:hypothetical protein [Eubacteriaceae bacterium]MDK2936483.1 hypothetical protein [Eubacteriaceae bacterium]